MLSTETMHVDDNCATSCGGGTGRSCEPIADFTHHVRLRGGHRNPFAASARWKDGRIGRQDYTDFRSLPAYGPDRRQQLALQSGPIAHLDWFWPAPESPDQPPPGGIGVTRGQERQVADVENVVPADRDRNETSLASNGTNLRALEKLPSAKQMLRLGPTTAHVDDRHAEHSSQLLRIAIDTSRTEQRTVLLERPQTCAGREGTAQSNIFGTVRRSSLRLIEDYGKRGGHENQRGRRHAKASALDLPCHRLIVRQRHTKSQRPAHG